MPLLCPAFAVCPAVGRVPSLGFSAPAKAVREGGENNQDFPLQLSGWHT